MEVRTRIAPSPTGSPHVGTLYIALFNMIFAKHHGGKFILRIEDTDVVRSRRGYEDAIYDSLRWIGVSWDEGPDIGGPFGPYRQSDRKKRYREVCEELLASGRAYKCFTTQEELVEMRMVAKKAGSKLGYDRRHRNLSKEEIAKFEASGRRFVVRLKVPLSGEVSFDDMNKGGVTCPCADIDDQVLMKSDGMPTYHLASVVDDHDMKISHIMRGDEWMSSTPKHVLIYEAFGWEPPKFIHMPLLLGLDGKKLSKRKNPTSVFFYRDSGYLPEAFCNFLTLMGYSVPGDEEIYPIDKIIREFDVGRLGVSGAIFDKKKLEWINQQYLINSIDSDELWDRIKNWGFGDEFMKKLMPLVHTRIKTFGDFYDLCHFFFTNHIHHRTDLLCPRKVSQEKAMFILQTLLWGLEESEDWGRESVNKVARTLAEIHGVDFKKDIIPILFATFMGKHTGPPLFDSVELLGQHRARARILAAIEFLGGISNKKMQALKESWKSGDLNSLSVT